MVAQLQLLAVGQLGNEVRELQAPSYFAPRTDVVEHRVVRWPVLEGTDEKWIAEVRVNYVMTHRSIFRGEHAQADATAWCEAVAPMAATAPTSPALPDGTLQAMIDYGDAVEVAEDAMIDALFAPVDDNTHDFDLSDPVDDAYAAGQAAYASGCYAPPSCTAEHDAYIRGYNDAWKSTENVHWFRR